MTKTLIYLVALIPGLALGAIKTQTVAYKQGGSVLEGYLSYDDAVKGKRPGVVVFHEWWGINDFIRGQTERLAKMGYVAFAADIFGKGVRPTTPDEAGKQAGFYKGDRPLLRDRAVAGLKALERSPHVDSRRLAAIGFCFGGTAALELARSGAEVKGVVSFHGGLSNPAPGDARNIKGKVLVLHGADDTYVPKAEVDAFVEEMKKAGANWQMTLYSGTVHSFTNPASGSDPRKGVAYNPQSAARAWTAMKDFFDEIFAPRGK